MTSIIRADNISTVAGTGTIAVQAGNTLDASAGFTTPAGYVIQVVQDVHSTEHAISTSTLTATSYSATITPTSTSNKILIMWSSAVRVNDSGQTDGRARLHIYRDGSDLIMMNRFFLADINGGHAHFSHNYLDSPNTTSAVTYAIYGASENAANIRFNDTSAVGSLVLMEIAG